MRPYVTVGSERLDQDVLHRSERSGLNCGAETGSIPGLPSMELHRSERSGLNCGLRNFDGVFLDLRDFTVPKGAVSIAAGRAVDEAPARELTASPFRKERSQLRLAAVVVLVTKSRMPSPFRKERSQLRR